MLSPHVSMQHITKSFDGVEVLRDVSFAIERPEIHALTGENGAGKSTLMKVLAGVLQPDSGTLHIEGTQHHFHHPLEAERKGIVFIHQELTLLPYLSIAANCFLGREIHTRLGVLCEAEMTAQTEQILRSLGLSISAATLVGELPIGHQQVVEIAKALLVPKLAVIIMDEPTSALSQHETEHLFDIIRTLKEKQVSVVYISHRMEEIFSICDRITVLRDGKHVHTGRVSEIDLPKTVSLMVGRPITQQFPEHHYVRAEQIFAVKDLNTPTLHDISFELFKGEILGIAGLVGAGRTDLLHTIFGSLPYQSGTMELEGKQLRHGSPHHSMMQGIAFVTEDRKAEGFIDVFDIEKNIGIANLDAITRFYTLSVDKERSLAARLCDTFHIRCVNTTQMLPTLSGGNQQKVVLAKWLASLPTLLLLDEPTRGVDVRSKHEIYLLMRQLCEQGVSIIMVSSELPEILGMSDRILVMKEGRICAEFTRSEAAQESIMIAATKGEAM